MTNSNKAKTVVAREYLSDKPDHLSWADAFDLVVLQDYHEDDNQVSAGVVLEDSFGILVWSQHEDSSIDDLVDRMSNLYDSIISVFVGRIMSN